MLPVTGDVGCISLRNARAEWPISTREMDDDDVSSSVVSSQVLSPDSSSTFALKGLSLNIEPGSLVMVVGAVGSGKSSFLNALLSEMTLREGELEVHGDISYVSQEPWIRNCSVKSNIVFESAFDAAKYESVLRASQLSLDLHALPNGDQTEIGERGINLSGGQKARVAIARAFYRWHDILILDGPLSAVDAHVAHAIFEESIVGLAANKTRLLVLNSHYDLLARADKIVDFQIVGDGTYDEVLANFPELRYENHHHGSETAEPKREPEPTEGDSATTMDMTSTQEATVLGEASPNAERLVRDEDRATGTVGGRIYRAYFDETGHNGILVLLVLVVVVYSVSQAMRVLVDWWQGFWASNMTQRGVDPSYSGTAFGMWYLGFIVVCTVVTLGRGIIMTEACVRSARNLHDDLF